MDLSRYGSAPPWLLGVEEELMLVDAATLEPARDGFSRVFGEPTDRIKPELFESFVEITTTAVETPEEAEAELRALRNEAAERAAAHGLAVLATGSHPTARGRVPDHSHRALPAPEGGSSAHRSTGSTSAGSTCMCRCLIRMSVCGRSRASCRGCRDSSPPL